MATSKKRPRVDVSDSPLTANIIDPCNLSDAHEFIAPNEICNGALGILHCLMTKRLINMSFSALYHKSLTDNWNDLLTRERRTLKANSNSIEKCFMINRLLTEYFKNPDDFTRRVRSLYDETRLRMSNTIPSSWALQDLYREIQAWRDLQCKRRLFYIKHEGKSQLHSLLGVQQVTTTLFTHLLKSTQAKVNVWRSKERHGLIELFSHSLIIIAQPTSPDCVAATKYEKIGQTYTAKLHTRIICLLNPDMIKDRVELSNIGVTLHLLHNQPDKEGEIQPELQWRRQEIIGAEGVVYPFLYAELSSLQLSKLDCRGNRPIYNSNLCRLQFRIKINTIEPVVKEELNIGSEPFGLCSHAQYFPELVAQAIIFEVERSSQDTGSLIPPTILTDFICCYYARVTGVEPKPGTCRFILSVMQAAHDAKNQYAKFKSIDVYRDALAKVISQIDFFTDHPFMAMMYHDGLFLGISNNRIDEQLEGSQERPHICIRFNGLQDHSATQSATIRYIVHDGQLTKATFHMRAFADEMCRFVYEATQERAAKARVLSEVPDRTYRDFSWYFNDELFRLSALAPDDKKAYKPLIPVLWTTMRKNNDDETTQTLSVPSPESDSKDSIQSSISPIQPSPSEATATINPSNTSNGQGDRTEKDDLSARSEISVSLHADTIIQCLTERLHEFFRSEVPIRGSSPLTIRLIKSPSPTATEANRSASQQEASSSSMSRDVSCQTTQPHVTLPVSINGLKASVGSAMHSLDDIPNGILPKESATLDDNDTISESYPLTN